MTSKKKKGTSSRVTCHHSK